MVFYINFAVKLRKLIMTPLTPIALWAGYSYIYSRSTAPAAIMLESIQIPTK